MLVDIPEFLDPFPPTGDPKNIGFKPLGFLENQEMLREHKDLLQEKNLFEKKFLPNGIPNLSILLLGKYFDGLNSQELAHNEF